MKHNPSQLGLRLCALRVRTGQTQTDLTAKCRKLGGNITRNMLANWETNRSEIPAHLIPVIAAALDVSVVDLLPDLPARPLRRSPAQKVAHRKPRSRRAANG